MTRTQRIRKVWEILLEHRPNQDIQTHTEAVQIVDAIYKGPSQGDTCGDPISLKVLETEHIKRIVKSSRTLGKAAAILGIDPATLYRKRLGR